MPETINMLRIDSENLSVSDYLNLLESNRACIKDTQIVPPQLGDYEPGGKIRVTYHTPIYAFPGDSR